MVSQEDAVQREGQRGQRLLAAVRLQLALPYRDGVPAHGGQLVLHVTVACLVAHDFAHPEVGARLGNLAARRAAGHLSGRGRDMVPVPETAVDEDARAVFAQHHVGTARQPRMVQPIAEPVSPQVAPHHQLGLGVLAVDGRHVTVSLLGYGLFGHDYGFVYFRGETGAPDPAAGRELNVAKISVGSDNSKYQRIFSVFGDEMGGRFFRKFFFSFVIFFFFLNFEKFFSKTMRLA